jgi:hypothetical protein
VVGGGGGGFRIDSRGDGARTKLAVFGVIDEHADLSAIMAARGAVEISLRGVRRINSFGVRAWVDAVRMIPRDTALVFVECPPPVIDQMNMVKGFLGHGTLESFYAPMTCEECDEQLDALQVADVCRAHGCKVPPTPCPRCGRDMEVDDLEEQYLLFLHEATSASQRAG